MATSTQQPDEQDAPWKKILREYFPEAIAFFFPEVAKAIDWTKPIEFLDKEFSKIAPDAATGKRFADQLVKVHLKRGKAIFLLVHVEIQAAREKDFAKRMFIYALRILDYFGQPATSLAILCDADPQWRPQRYSFDLPGTSLDFAFSTIKLLDYQAQWAALEQSRNPFAWVVMAQLKLQETKQDKVSRKMWKLRLIRGLYESGYNRMDVVNLFHFIDWILTLPKPLENEFWQELKAYEEERKMPYITSVQRIGREEGRKEGREEGREEATQQTRSMLTRQLTRKLGALPDRLLNRISALAMPELESLSDVLLDFETIDDLMNWLDNLN
jgi:hypothetical protein